MKLTIPSGEAGAGTYLPTWSGHGDALALWRQEPDGTLTLANSYQYDTWGRPTTATHSGIADLGFRFLYVGEFDVQWDDAFGLGLAYMHARHYHPVLGRFLQPDPDGSEANLYTYTANSPVTELDPDGTCFIILCVAVGVILFGGLGAGAGALRYSTGTEPWLLQSDSVGDAAVGGFVEAGSYAIPGAGVGAATKALAKVLSKVPKAARVLRGPVTRIIQPRVVVRAHTNPLRFTPDQNALIQLAKGARARGPISPREADILDLWRTEYGLRGHGPAFHPLRPKGLLRNNLTSRPGFAMLVG